MKTIKWETADNMMNIVAFTVMKSKIERGEQVDLEAIKKFATDMFQEYCDMVGITEVEDPEEENSEGFDEDAEDDFDTDYFDSDDDDEENTDDNVMYSLTVKGEFALRYMEAGHTFEEACRVADILFGKIEGE